MYKLFCSLLLLPFIGTAMPDTNIIKKTSKADIILFTPHHFSAGEPTEVTVRIKNKLPVEWTGYLTLELWDEQNGQNIDGLFANVFANQYFTVDLNDSVNVNFPLTIPNRFTHNIRVYATLFDKQPIDSLSIILPFKP